jgi:uncharacterized protein YbaP (TraB family)
MKRGLGLLVMFVSLVGTSCKKHEKQESTPIAADTKQKSEAADPWKKEAPKKDPLKSILFWKAEKDGKTTYFLGTMHMGVEPETRLPQIVWDKLDAAPTFAMEADLSDPKLAETMFRKSGSLKEDLGEDYWKKVETKLGASTAAQMERMTPMGAAALMSLKDLPKTSPMDGVLLGRAINQKKKIVYLEEGALQAAILAKYLDIKALKMMIDTAEHGAAQTKAMLDAYVGGSPEGILKVTEDQKADSLAHGYTEKEYAEQMEEMVYKRNASWIDKLEKMHADGGGFVAVGALHLIGKRSVLEMLGEKGFTITRLNP